MMHSQRCICGAGPQPIRDHRTYRTMNGQACANTRDWPEALSLAVSHAL